MGLSAAAVAPGARRRCPPGDRPLARLARAGRRERRPVRRPAALLPDGLPLVPALGAPLGGPPGAVALAVGGGRGAARLPAAARRARLVALAAPRRLGALLAPLVARPPMR